MSIPQSYYEDLKYKIDIVITNEQIDMASRLTTLQTVLQILGSNPSILQDRRTKKVFYRLLDLAGISPLDLAIEEEEPKLEEAVSRAVRGGSIARPMPAAAPPEVSIPARL